MPIATRAIITGASSGIGEALARLLSQRGVALGLLARRGELLDDLVRTLPSAAIALPCDVGDGPAVAAAARRGEEALGGVFDLAVANAGVGLPSHATKFNLQDATTMIEVNVLGMFHLFDAVIPGMVERRSGHFAGIASIAGLRGLPAASVYSASKSAMQSFLEAGRIELAPYGVWVTTVNPGFVRTPMTEKNRFPMPFLMGPDKAAQIIARGLERRARVIEFPLPMSLLMRAVRLLPSAVFERMMAPYARRKWSS